MDLCGICDNEISSDKSKLKEKGLAKVLEISNERNDGLAEKLKARNLPIPIHIKCRKQFKN